jgi:hypothetical protein
MMLKVEFLSIFTKVEDIGIACQMNVVGKINIDSGSGHFETVIKANDLGGSMGRFILFIRTPTWIHSIYSIIFLFLYTCQKGIF